jgi:hypothetical protein
LSSIKIEEEGKRKERRKQQQQALSSSGVKERERRIKPRNLIELKQVGAPNVPSAFTARSREGNQSRHILVALVTMLCNSYVYSCCSGKFMSFLSIYVIHVIS